MWRFCTSPLVSLAAVVTVVGVSDARPHASGGSVDRLVIYQEWLADCPDGCSPYGGVNLYASDPTGIVRRLSWLERRLRGAFVHGDSNADMWTFPVFSPDGRFIA